MLSDKAGKHLLVDAAYTGKDFILLIWLMPFGEFY